MSVDYVVKIGGSLLVDLEKASAFLRKAAKAGPACVFTVGSGPLGDAFKDFAATSPAAMPFGPWVECWSAIQSINARLIVSLHDSYTLCGHVRQIEEALAGGRNPVVDAKDFVPQYLTLTRQMSDVRSAVVAGVLGCRRLVILTDVEGVFSSDPRVDSTARKLRALTAHDPILRSRTSVDEGLAEQLIEHGITAFVIGVDGYLASERPLEEYLAAHASVISPGRADALAAGGWRLPSGGSTGERTTG
jgi:aspartokinase-like uncharacterized kinase